MIDDLTITEKQFADIKAAEYLAKGYQVSREAPIEFLPGYRADLLVKKEDETKVIEIKTQPSLAANPALRQFERIINSRPGWSFELQLVGEPEGLAVTEDARALDETGIIGRLSQAEAILDAGFAEAALLMAWSATEAVVRMLVAAEGIAITRATNPAYILGMAVAHGAMDRDDYRQLLIAMAYRNAIAHGLEAGDFTGTLVIDLVAMARLFLREYNEIAASDDGLE